MAVFAAESAGSGGYGVNGANGGAGAAATMTNAVTGSTRKTAACWNSQETAEGGAGGGVIPFPTSYGSEVGAVGAAGAGSASLTFDDDSSVTQSLTVSTEITVDGGAGGSEVNRKRATPPAGPGQATATTDLTGARALSPTPRRRVERAA